MLSCAKDYDVSLLLSSDLVSILSKKAQGFCRQVDSVKTKSFLLGLFTVDYSTELISKESGA